VQNLLFMSVTRSISICCVSLRVRGRPIIVEIHRGGSYMLLMTNCLDASALVKWYVPEIGSDILRQYLSTQQTIIYTTLFCYFEALSVLKVKRFYKKAPENITDEVYQKAAFELSAWFSAFSKTMPDLDLIDPIVFPRVQEIARKHQIDISDAFQILSVIRGFFSPLCGNSKTILVTADKRLAHAARAEGARVWNLLTEPPP
jgi:predicted nucleic acid-binding protein